MTNTTQRTFEIGRASSATLRIAAALAFSVFLVVIAGRALGAQDIRQARLAQATPAFKTDVDLVALDVCVRDGSGRLLPDLSTDDFLVLEDGKPQRVAFLVPSTAVPLRAVLLLDMSASMSGAKFSRALDAARAFAAMMAPDDRLEIIAFNHRTIRLHGFRDDPANIARSLDSAIERARAAIGETGTTALYDALLVASSDLASPPLVVGPDTRDVIVLLSDGEDTSSRVAFDDVLPAIRRSRALVYSVSIRSDERGRWLGGTWPMLQLARETGGRALGVPTLDALPGLYREIQAELRHLYRVAYVSTNPLRDGRWRTVVVRVPSHDAHVTTRAGYYAARAAASF